MNKEMMMTKNAIFIAGLLFFAALSSTSAAASGTCVMKKPSSCQGSWNLDVRNSTDRCYMVVLGHYVKGNYTVPSGYRHLNHPKRHGWQLRTNEHGNRDYWFKSYRCN